MGGGALKQKFGVYDYSTYSKIIMLNTLIGAWYSSLVFCDCLFKKLGQTYFSSENNTSVSRKRCWVNQRKLIKRSMMILSTGKICDSDFEEWVFLPHSMSSSLKRCWNPYELTMENTFFRCHTVYFTQDADTIFYGTNQMWRYHLLNDFTHSFTSNFEAVWLFCIFFFFFGP